MGRIGIIRESGIEEIVSDTDVPKLLFGLNNAPSQKSERRSIGHALQRTGLEVYATNVLWPLDRYVLENGLCLSQSDFGELGHGGNYIFGDKFVLVSAAIQDKVEKHMEESLHFRNFFSGRQVIFLQPYSGTVTGIDGFGLKPTHIDLTVGYVPKANVLHVDEAHYNQEERLFEELRRRFKASVATSSSEVGMQNYFPNNFSVIRDNGSVIVVANKLNPPFSRNDGIELITTDKEITNLPGKFGGSVGCAVNFSPTVKLWDALGIDYARWGINPKEPANYERR